MVSLMSHAAEVKIISWKTEHASAPAKLGEKNQSLLPFIRFGVSSLSESQTMKFTFFGGKTLGLNDKHAKELDKLLASEYKKNRSQ